MITIMGLCGLSSYYCAVVETAVLVAIIAATMIVRALSGYCSCFAAVETTDLAVVVVSAATGEAATAAKNTSITIFNNILNPSITKKAGSKLLSALICLAAHDAPCITSHASLLTAYRIMHHT